MAYKKKTLIEIAIFAVLEGLMFRDDDGAEKQLIDIQVDIATRRCTCSFDNGDKQNIGLSDPVEVNVDALSLTTAHTHPQSSIHPNKKQFKKKKRDN